MATTMPLQELNQKEKMQLIIYSGESQISNIFFSNSNKKSLQVAMY